MILFPLSYLNKAFSPIDVAGLIFWGDPTDSTTINAGSPSPADPISTLVDKSGTSNDASQGSGTEQPLWQTTHIDFDGSNDNLELDTSVADLSATTKGAISLRVRPTDGTPASAEYLIAFSDTDGNEGLLLRILSSGVFSVIAISGTTDWTLNTDAAAASTGVWTHLGVIHDGTSATVYVDGVEVAQTLTVSTSAVHWFSHLTMVDNGRMGCRNINSAGDVDHYDGDIRDITIYDDEITPIEMASLSSFNAP